MIVGARLGSCKMKTKEDAASKKRAGTRVRGKEEREWEGSDSDERSEETAVQATYHLQV